MVVCIIIIGVKVFIVFILTKIKPFLLRPRKKIYLYNSIFNNIFNTKIIEKFETFTIFSFVVKMQKPNKTFS